MNSFPGNIGQIYQSKFRDAPPEFPLEFPDALKSSIANGWSKKPRERPKIEEFRSVLISMLKQAGDNCFAPIMTFPTYVFGEYLLAHNLQCSNLYSTYTPIQVDPRISQSPNLGSISQYLLLKKKIQIGQFYQSHTYRIS